MKHKGIKDRALKLNERAGELRKEIDAWNSEKEGAPPWHLTVEISNMSFEYLEMIKKLTK